MSEPTPQLSVQQAEKEMAFIRQEMRLWLHSPDCYFDEDDPASECDCGVVAVRQAVDHALAALKPLLQEGTTLLQLADHDANRLLWLVQRVATDTPIWERYWVDLANKINHQITKEPTNDRLHSGTDQPDQAASGREIG